MKNFQKSDFSLIRKDIDDALKVVADKYGITFRLGRISYTSAEFSTKLECVCNDGVDVKDGEDLMAKKEWDRNCWKWNLKPEDFGKGFNFQGTDYTICGCKPKSSKYPILGKSEKNGRTYKLPKSAVSIYTRV